MAVVEPFQPAVPTPTRIDRAFGQCSEVSGVLGDVGGAVEERAGETSAASKPRSSSWCWCERSGHSVPSTADAVGAQRNGEPTAVTTRAEDAAAARKAADRHSRPLRLAAVAVCAAAVLLRAASGIAGLVETVAALILTAALPWGVFRFDRYRYTRRLPHDVLAQAPAAARRGDPDGAGPTARGRSGSLIVGVLQIGRSDLAWRPRPRFAKRGTPELVVPWANVTQASWARLSSPWLAWLVRVDVFCFELADGRTVTRSVTSPELIHDALSHIPVRVLPPEGSAHWQRGRHRHPA